ncbi:hypothetical protein SERLA73DRAFT_48109, partial [Serpula lacrymans var. lacrymans S7.3]
FMNRIGAMVEDLGMLMFTNGSSKDDRTPHRKYGWGLEGFRCTKKQCFVPRQRYSLLLILTLDVLITYEIVEGFVTSAHFV